MPDLLTHALVAYTVCTLLSWRYAWLTPPYVTAGMVGALLPDLVKVNLLVGAPAVGEFLSLPFAWTPLHTLGGSFVSVGLGVVFVRHAERGRVAALLGLGAATHLVADGFLQTPTGAVGAFLWPVWTQPIRLPGLYLSTDPRPTLVALLVAGVVAGLTRHRRGGDDL